MNTVNKKFNAFTLTEMMVVTGIITIAIVIAFPTLRAMTEGSSARMGANAVAVAITATRSYAVRNINFIEDLIPADVSVDQGLYSGAAAIFTPAHEVRITQNTEGAWFDFGGAAGVMPLERRGPDIGSTLAAPHAQMTSPPERELNGFIDVNIDYIELLEDTGVCGILRIINTNKPLLIPPPFAVWFDQNGALVAGNETYQHVFYNGDDTGDGWDVNDGRSYTGNWPSLGYDPNTYDPNHASFNTNNWDNIAKRYRIPYERLETVIGVFVYSKKEFQEAVDVGDVASWNSTTNASVNDTRWAWMEQNGSLLLFSRQTGNLIRSADE